MPPAARSAETVFDPSEAALEYVVVLHDGQFWENVCVQKNTKKLKKCRDGKK